MAEIAVVPAAPPSKLSKKLIELQIPTIQTIVIAISNTVEPVGFPRLFPAISNNETTKAAMLCPMNLGNGDNFFISSQSPINPSASAGSINDEARKKLLRVKFDKSKDM